jgi:hypothetical protein
MPGTKMDEETRNHIFTMEIVNEDLNSSSLLEEFGIYIEP